MKRNKIRIFIFLGATAVAVVAAILIWNIVLTIGLANIERVTRIEMWQVNSMERTGHITVETQNDIETIYSALTGARRTELFNSATSPAPLVENFLAIWIYGLLDGEETLYHRLFLYSDVYIWNSYVGIYRITQENSDKIWQVYLENISGME